MKTIQSSTNEQNVFFLNNMFSPNHHNFDFSRSDHYPNFYKTNLVFFFIGRRQGGESPECWQYSLSCSGCSFCRNHELYIHIMYLLTYCYNLLFFLVHLKVSSNLIVVTMTKPFFIERERHCMLQPIPVLFFLS